MEAIDRGATTTSQVGDNVVVESGVPYSSHSPPLVQQPSQGNSSFHSPLEGHVDHTRPDFGPNAPFWETPIGQAIASFGTHVSSPESEEERRQYHATILRAQEVETQIDNILGSSPVRSTFLLVGYRSLADSMRPIEPIIDRPLTTHIPGQISTPLTSYVMSNPNPPRYFASRAQPSIPVSLVHLNARGETPGTNYII